MTEDHTTGPDRLLLYGTVTISGAAVMMLELLGTRIIGPFYGVSLYVWSSLISVALIALALGYYLGGLVADKQTRFRLSYAIALAGLTTAAIPLVSRPVLLWTNDLGLRAGAFTSALLPFFPATDLPRNGGATSNRASGAAANRRGHGGWLGLCGQHSRQRGGYLAIGLFPVASPWVADNSLRSQRGLNPVGTRRRII